MVVGVDLNTVVADEAAPRGPRREPWLQLGNPGVVAVDLSTYLYATLRAADLSGTDLTGDQMLYVASTTLRAVQDDLGMFPSDSPPTTVLLVGELVDDAAKLEGRPAAHRLQFAHKPIYDAAQDGNWQEFDKLRGEYARERAPLLFVIKAMAAHAFGWALALAPRQADGTLLLGDTVISIDGDLVVLAAGQGRTVLRPAGGGGDTVRLFRDQQLAAAGWSPARLRMLALLGGSDTQPYGVYGLGGVRIERLARMLPADVEAGGMAAVLGWLMQQGFLGDEEQQLLRQAALRAVAPMLAQPVLHVASAKPDAGAGRTWLDGRTFWVGPLFDLADVGCQDYEPSAAEQHDMQLLAALSANDVGRIARMEGCPIYPGEGLFSSMPQAGQHAATTAVQRITGQPPHSVLALGSRWAPWHDPAKRDRAMQVEDGLARLGVMSLVDGKAIKSTEANNSVTLRGSARGTPRSSVLGRAVASLEDYQNPYLMMLDVGPFMPGGHQPPQQPPRLERVHIVATRPYAAARVNVQGLPRIIGGQAVAFRLTGGGALAFHLVSQEDATATRRAIKRGDLADVPDVLSRRPGFVFLDDGPGAGGGGGDGGGPDNGGGGGLSCASIEALQARVVAALEPASRSGGAFMDRLAQPERSTAGVSLVTPQHGVPLYAAALGTLTYADVSQHLPADWEPEAELIEVVRGAFRRKMLEYVVKALAGQLEHYSRTVGVMFNPSDGTWGVAGTRHRGHTVAGARGKSVAERKADAEERALQRRLPSLPGELEYGMQVLVETMRDEFEADARRAGLAAAEAAAEAAGRVAAVAARVRRIIDGTFSGTARWDKVLNEICDSCEVEAEAEAGRAERDRLWPEALHDVAAGAFGLAELALEDEVCAGYPVYHKPKKDLRTHVQRRQRRLERYVDLDTSPPVIVSVHGAAIDAAWRQWQAEQEQAAAE